MNQQQTQESLLARQEALSKRLAAVRADLAKSHSADWSEQAQERENDEVLEEIASQTASELSLINKALERLKQGDYGICSRCGEAIATERLEAIPEASTCIKCA